MLDEKGQNECEGLLTEAEYLESLNSMESNKSPGSDGLSDVHHYLLNALNCAYAKRTSSSYSKKRTNHPFTKKEQTGQFLKELETNYPPKL